MSLHTYSEDSLVEQPAIQLFAKLGWQTVTALEEVFGLDGTLGRETKGEAVLVPRLRTALERRGEKGTGYFVAGLTGPTASKRIFVAVFGGETLKNFQARFPGTVRVEQQLLYGNTWQRDMSTEAHQTTG